MKFMRLHLSVLFMRGLQRDLKWTDLPNALSIQLGLKKLFVSCNPTLTTDPNKFLFKKNPYL